MPADWVRKALLLFVSDAIESFLQMLDVVVQRWRDSALDTVLDWQRFQLLGDSSGCQGLLFLC